MHHVTRTSAARKQPQAHGKRAPRPYMNPYYAGVGIGLVLLGAFVIMGRGLGASGAFSAALTSAVAQAAPQHANANASYAPYLATGGFFRDWLVLEVIGIALGGFLSGWLAGRFRWASERGPHASERARMLTAVSGGLLMGIGAKLARGCTSGQALTGGALLATGSWIFIAACFLAAYAVAPLLRRHWQ
jgi:uncharacterized membrane protein YedE/YeeE